MLLTTSTSDTPYKHEPSSPGNTPPYLLPSHLIFSFVNVSAHQESRHGLAVSWLSWAYAFRAADKVLGIPTDVLLLSHPTSAPDHLSSDPRGISPSVVWVFPHFLLEPRLTVSCKYLFLKPQRNCVLTTSVLFASSACSGRPSLNRRGNDRVWGKY